MYFWIAKSILKNTHSVISRLILIPDNTDRCESGLIMPVVILRNLEFWIELYLVRQVLKNTDRVLSGLILNKVLLESLEFEIEWYVEWH